MQKLIEALCHHGPITPQLKGPSEYQRNQQLVEIVRLAAYGSTTHLYLLSRMSPENWAIAWRYSKAETKSRMQATYKTQGMNADA